MKIMAGKRIVVTISGLAAAFAVLLFGGYALSQEAGMTTTSPDGTYSAGVNSPNGMNSDVSATLDVNGLGAGDSAVHHVLRHGRIPVYGKRTGVPP